MFIFITLLLIYIIYKLLNSKYDYWAKRGVIGPRPQFFFGNLRKVFFFKISPGELYTEIYNAYPGADAVGLYKNFTPALLLRSPELIKELTIKNFSSFHDNDFYVDKKNDPIFGRNPVSLRGEEWKVTRSYLSPIYTSGKIKFIYPYSQKSAKHLLQYLHRKSKSDSIFELKEFCVRFALESVAGSAFGIEGNCFEDQPSEFQKLAVEFANPGTWTSFALFLSLTFPPLAQFLAIRLIPKAVETKLVELVSEVLKARKDNNVVLNDFLQVLDNLKTSSKEYEFTDVDIAAQAALLLGESYESISAVMSLVLYYLSKNLDVQDKLRQEVVEAFDDSDDISYERFNDLHYLTAAVQETLRLHPAVYFLQKLCTKNYESDDKSLRIEKGTTIILPIHGIQNDSKFFEAPEQFEPERFLSPQKENIAKCRFFPFGEGPRSCLGQRFALLQIKIGVAYIVKNYELSFNAKTKQPLVLDPTNFVVSPIGGLWANLKKINS